jgi:hypothetical protein
MAFVRANPGGWAVGDILTSAQQNAIDIDHANALDKTVAGDTFSGTLTQAGTGSIVLPFANGVVGNLSFAIVANAASAIGSVVPNGIICAGGPTDWVALSSRSRVIRSPLLPLGTLTGSNWTAAAEGGSNFAGVGTPPGPSSLTGVGSGGVGVMIWMPVHNGATLTTVKMFMEVGNSHTNVPATFPAFDIRRMPVGTYAGSTVSLFAGGPATATAGSGAAWFNGGNIQNWSGTCNQNNVIDTTTYLYYLALFDESGANSKLSNAFFGMELTFASITSSSFP